MRKSIVVPSVVCITLSLLYCSGDASKDDGDSDLPVPAASEVQRLIKAKGAKAVLQELYQDETRWTAVLEKMSGGDQEWLAILIELSGVADAGSASELESVVATVLASAPERALETLEPAFGLETLCQNIMSVGIGQSPW